jgi:hypothetical protein
LGAGLTTRYRKKSLVKKAQETAGQTTLKTTLRNKGTRAEWLEKVFTGGQGTQRFVMPIIIIIII